LQALPSLPSPTQHRPLTGDADTTCHIDATGRRAAQLIPGAVLKVYSGAAHGLFLTHAAALNDDLSAFLMT